MNKWFIQPKDNVQFTFNIPIFKMEYNELVLKLTDSNIDELTIMLKGAIYFQHSKKNKFGS